MRGRVLLLVSTVALAALVAAIVAVAGAGGHTAKRTAAVAPAAAKHGATVRLRRTKLGRILVTSSGRTLYLFEKDKHGRSACFGACAKAWPPLMTHGRPRAGKGVSARLLGTTRRPNGREVTYAGHPLYRFIGDRRAGQTNGEGSKAFGAGWYVLKANGKKIDKS